MIKPAIKELISKTLDYTGISSRKIHGMLNRYPNWLVLMYHRIVTDRKQYDPFSLGMCVEANVFDMQLRYLKKHFTVLPVSEVMRKITQHEPLPPNVVSITFDDGYKDNLLNAAPILQQHQVNASVYIATNILYGEVFWWDRVIQIFAESQCADFEIEIESTTYHVRRDRSGVEWLLAYLWQLNSEIKEQIINQLLAGKNIVKDLSLLYLNEQELQQITQYNFEVGAHTCSHPNLSLMKQSDIESELIGSKQTLERILQTEINGFAYPGGYIGDQTIDVIKKLNFEYALTTITGVNSFEQNPYLIKRMGMPDSSLSDFKRCLSNVLGSREH
ncbi:polysaccharide deacetylase family protein [Aliikangiella maris]|uniref:Polysaccharide deacetylase family protein n=2 Tax=Aliikangiella maris TaxID=3162458 RepID=A0ABV2BXU5_9GAMM